MKNRAVVRCILLSFLSIFNITLVATDPSSSHPFISSFTFRTIADHVVDETGVPFNPSQVQEADIVYVQTDHLPHFFENLHPKIAQRYILITHNGDIGPMFLRAPILPLSLSAYYASHPHISFTQYLDDPHIIVWFTANLDYIHPKLKPLPTGLANNHWPHGNVEMFRKAMKSRSSFEERQARVYVNMSIGTNKSAREALYLQCQKSPFCDLFTFVFGAAGAARNLEDMKRYRYILSPPGNGVDCHRHWEALLMGCIPVMQHSMLDQLFDDLPVIFVNEWSQMTAEYLEQEYQKLMKRTFNYERLFANHWFAAIKAYKQ